MISTKMKELIIIIISIFLLASCIVLLNKVGTLENKHLDKISSLEYRVKQLKTQLNDYKQCNQAQEYLITNTKQILFGERYSYAGMIEDLQATVGRGLGRDCPFYVID